ncbi:aspartic proteinase nepenthesin-1-like [Malus sylvestris]|uniref:aspartic proteinase nepenthesin-1-like n=1 Tax=Malus sylvestris TaxID=3752 RepID=UPI0021AC834A|nr:aspartic proteinase nepenthesin-1-like [Malus sylvestris]
MSLMRKMSHNILLFSLGLVAFLMFATSMGGKAQGFSIKMFTTLSPNLTLLEKHQKLIQVSKSRAHRFQPITNPNSSSPVLVPNTIRSYVRHAFSDFFYTVITIGTPPQVANLAIDTGSAFTWVQSAECRKCIVTPLPGFDLRKSSSSRVLPYNHPLCVPPFLSPRGRGCSYLLEYADRTTTEGLVGFEKFTFLSEKGQQDVPLAFGLGLVNNIIFSVRDDDHPNPIIGIMGLGRDHPTSILRQLTLLRFSYCLAPQFEATPSLLHFGDDAKIIGATNVRSTPILGGPDDHYYVRLNGISLNGQLLPIDPNLFKLGGGGVVVDTGAPYSLIVDEAFQILRQAVVDYFYNMYQWQPIPKTARDDFDLCYDFHTVFTAPSVMLHFEGGDMEVHKPSLFTVVEKKSELCMTILSLGTSENLPSIVGAVQQVNYKFLFDVGARMLHFAEEDC